MLMVAIPAARIDRLRNCCRWRPLPNIDSPTIQVTAQLPGADGADRRPAPSRPPLERQVRPRSPGLTQMTSEQRHRVCARSHCQFSRSRTVDSAAQDVQAAINAAAGQPAADDAKSADLPEGPTRLTHRSLMLALTSETLPAHRGQRLRKQHPGAEDFPDARCRPRHHRAASRTRRSELQVNPAQLAGGGTRPGGGCERAPVYCDCRPAQGHGLYGANQAFALQTNDQLMTAEGFKRLHPRLSYRYFGQ